MLTIWAYSDLCTVKYITIRDIFREDSQKQEATSFSFLSTYTPSPLSINISNARKDHFKTLASFFSLYIKIEDSVSVDEQIQ